MFIDASAFVAILTDGPEASGLTDAIAASKHRYTSPVVRVDACIQLSALLDITPEAAQSLFDAVIEKSRIKVIVMTNDIGKIAVSTF